jgi:PKD repeat protein
MQGIVPENRLKSGGVMITRYGLLLTVIGLFLYFCPSAVWAQKECEADFSATPTSGCAPLKVTFTSESQGATGYSWSFPGGTPGSATGPGPVVVKYNSAGTYSVTLEIQCGLSGSDKLTKKGYIQVSDCTCIPDFNTSSRSGIAPHTVTFTDASTNAVGWIWSFPGGQPSAAQTQGPHQVTYNQPGTYDVSLTIQCPNGTETITREDWIDVRSEQFDYGDAPDANYGTLSNSNGAYHSIVDGLYLGQGVDAEIDGQPDFEARGDDTGGQDDEDGVQFPEDLFIGQEATLTITASQGGHIKAWIDFNQDMDWDDAGETVIDGQIAAGGQEFVIDIPPDTKEGETYARFRYSNGNIPTSKGGPIDGEVEDYIIEFNPVLLYDFGDAPDGQLAYRHDWLEYGDDDVIGEFRTCTFDIRHGNRGERYFGASVDYEAEGNNGSCDSTPDQDELIGDGDAGLCLGSVYTIIDNGHTLLPVFAGGETRQQMLVCDDLQWGEHLDIEYTVEDDDGAYINVLVDWNQNGTYNDDWGRNYNCPDDTDGTGAMIELSTDRISEYILKDFYVPQGSGRLSYLDPPGIKISDPPGYKWMRFTITERPIENDDWRGGGSFADGETEDYMIYVTRTWSSWDAIYGEHGDAPDGNPAYPFMDPEIDGAFPTCNAFSHRGIVHSNEGAYHDMFFGYRGQQPTLEATGNRDICPGPYNRDDDRALMHTIPYTIDGYDETAEVNPEFTPSGSTHPNIGTAGTMASWGPYNLDIRWANESGHEIAYVNVLIDWNQDGQWGGSVEGEDGTAHEHVLQNFMLLPHSSGAGLSDHEGGTPPDFRIGPNSGYVWARFTISEEPVPTPWDGNGRFEDGETEDYLLKVYEPFYLFDFGDIEDYFTGHRQHGARHLIDPDLFLGDSVDGDEDGQEDKDAQGDDKDGNDDDDGVEFTSDLVPGAPVTLTVKASAEGFLNVWIDIDRNHSWAEPEDHIFQDRQLSAGLNTLSWTLPADAAPGKTYARFRFSDVTGLSYDGPHFNGDPEDPQQELPPAGEVEDYVVYIEDTDREYDFGDARDPDYPTRAASMGAWHIIDPALYMGQRIDAETDAFATPMAIGDDTSGVDDEDGVEFLNDWTVGDSAVFNVTVSDSGYLQLWADWNDDGDWQDSDEHCIRDSLLGAGTTTLYTLVPLHARFDTMSVRFRFSRAAGLSERGLAPDGEVEDYVIISPTTAVEPSDENAGLPETTIIYPNYPNPFNHRTVITFQTEQPAEVTLTLCNVRGQTVKTLTDGFLQPGTHKASWDGFDEQGRLMPTGIYFCRLQVDQRIQTIKLLFLK